MNLESEVKKFGEFAPAGYVAAFDVTRKGPEFFFAECDVGWQEIYEARNYYITDPVVWWSLFNNGNKRWSEIIIPDVCGVLKAARVYGLRYGAIFSRLRDGKKSFLSLSRSDRELTDQEMAFVSAEFDKVLEVFQDLPELSDKEAAVLALTQEGLTYQAIADRLDISASAVKDRLRRAREKLNAKTTTEAVGEAIRRRII